MNLTLTTDQQITLDSFGEFLTNPEEKYMVIQGSSGCGKSTLIPYLANVAKQYYEMRALLLKKQRDPNALELVMTATTNPAVAVLESLTNTEGSTIYAHLKLTPRKDFKTGEMKFLPGQGSIQRTRELIIIDEGSMLDFDIANHVEYLTDDKCKVVIMGDKYQLAPVGQTVTIMEQMNCRKTSMNQVMRNSGIITATGAQFRDSVDTGIFKAIPTGHKELLHVDGPTFKQMIKDSYTSSMYKVKNDKILAWTNRTIIGYNKHVRKMRNEPENFVVGETVFTNQPIIMGKFHRSTDAAVTITGMGSKQDKYDIMGREVEIDSNQRAFLPENQLEVKTLLKSLARKKAWTKYYTVKESWLDLRLPYASTVHKAQGSSYNTVFINLTDIGRNSLPSEVARLLYVAISRARYKVVFYGKLPPWYDGTITGPITKERFAKHRMEWEAGIF